MDEPTLGLDPAGHRQVLALLRAIARQRRVTVVLSTHALGDVEEICSRVVILDRGRVAADGAIADIAGIVSPLPRARIAVPAGRSAAAREVLAGVPGVGVEEVADQPGTLLVSAAGGDPDRALRALVVAGVPVLSYEARRDRLDDTFLAITGPEVR
jgi:ABC-2 type transport system ATP-binding protein